MPEPESTVALEKDPPHGTGHFVRRAALYQLAGELHSLAEDLDRLAEALDGVGEAPSLGLVSDVEDCARAVIHDLQEMDDFGWYPQDSGYTE